MPGLLLSWGNKERKTMYDSHLSLFFIPRLLCGVSRLCYRLVMKLAELNALYLCWHVLWLKLFLCTAFLRKKSYPPLPTPVATLGIWRRKKESVVLTVWLDHDVDPLPNPSPVCVDDTVWLDIDPLPNPPPLYNQKTDIPNNVVSMWGIQSGPHKTKR